MAKRAALVFLVLIASIGGSHASFFNAFHTIPQDVLGRRDTNTVTVFAPTTTTLTYDLNGTLRFDGTRAFDYDEENRLTRVTVTNAFKAEWVYDGLSRRGIKREYTWQGSWVKTNEVRLIFDGNLVIQERDTNNIVLFSYTRGIDLSGSRDGTGGIGGLLAFTQNATTNHSFYHADGNGNITALVSTGQVVAATYM